MSADSAQEQLKNIWEGLSENVKLLEEGKTIDLKEMEDKTKELCNTIRELPNEQAKEFQAELLELITYLNKTAAKLTEQKNDLQESSNKINKQQEGVNAYNKANNNSSS